MTGSGMRSFGLVAIVVSVLIVGCVPFLMSGDADAASSDPGWRDPPEVPSENVFSYSFGSPDEPLTTTTPAVSWTFGVDSYDEDPAIYVASRNLAAAIEDTRSGASGVGWYLPVEDKVAPSWITYSADLVSIVSTGSVTFTVHPAAQTEGEHSTHGSYWFYFEATYHGTSGDTVEPYLFMFDVYVDWDEGGGVITPPEDEKVYFRLNLDYGQSDLQDTSLFRIADSGSLSAVFDLPSAADREDLVFSGWSLSEGGPATYVDSFTLAIGADNVTVTEEGGVSYYTVTLYAVWSPEGLVIPTMWDELTVLLSDPLVLLFLAAGFLCVCAFIRSRNDRGY